MEEGNVQGRRTHSSSMEDPIPTEEDNRLQAAYTVLYTVPRAIEHYIDKEYKGGFLQAIRDHKDQLKTKLRSDEWDLLSQLIVHHRLYHFYDKIKEDAILDKDVLDKLISRCILGIDDRAEIEHYHRQSDRNKCILDLLIQRPQDSYSVLLEVLKESPTCPRDLIECMESKTTHQEVDSHSMVKSSITGNHSVRLQKNYHHLTQNLSDVRNVIDSLISKGVLEPDDHADIASSGMPAEMNRKLIAKIRSEQDYLSFLEALKEDPGNEELTSDLESTDVSKEELNLVQTGFDTSLPTTTKEPECDCSSQCLSLQIVNTTQIFPPLQRLDKKTLSSFRRKHTCADDNRISSFTIGLSAGVFLALVCITIVLLDVFTYCIGHSKIRLGVSTCSKTYRLRRC